MRTPIPAPARAYDYGGTGIGDFDGDGRADLALAMHLRGFAALLSRDEGAWLDASNGLPARHADAALHGSGTGLAVLPHPGGDRLLLLTEPLGAAPGSTAAPGVAEYAWNGRRWDAVTIAPRVRGSDASLALDRACGALLAVDAAGNNHLPLFERGTRGWHAIAAPALESAPWFTDAVMATDLDGRGCPDLVLARSLRVHDGWESRVDAFVRDSGTEGWSHIPIDSGRSDRRVTALHAARVADGAIDVLAGDRLGGVDRYLVRSGRVQWIAHLPAPDWRAGCGVSAIDGWTEADGARHWIVAFAGENDLHQPRRCRNGGGLVELAWRALAPPP